MKLECYYLIRLVLFYLFVENNIPIPELLFYSILFWLEELKEGIIVKMMTLMMLFGACNPQCPEWNLFNSPLRAYKTNELYAGLLT